MRFADPDSPRVYVPPPFLYVAALVAAWLLARRWPLGWPSGELVASLLEGLGVFLAALGAMLDGWSLLHFLRAGTSPLPVQPTTAVVLGGPYRVTRNPMYLGMTLLLVGCGLLLANVWTLLLAPFVVLTIDRLVIAREERYLEGKFGEGYLDYKRRVRRWL